MKAYVLAVASGTILWIGAPAHSAGAALTGKYICKPVHGELYLLEEPGNKVKFGLTALWVGSSPGNVNTGRAAGTAVVKNGEASYKDPDMGYTLKMNFKHSQVSIHYSGDGFGGLNVTPEGTYKKVNSKTPSTSDLNPPG